MMAILTDVKWYLTVIFDLYFSDVSDVEHLFIYACRPICISSLEKCLLSFYVHFKI